MDNEPERYLFELEDYYLMHSGVEGMEPGDRNGPPYPLDSSIRAMLSARARAKKEEKEEKRKVYLSDVLKRADPEEVYKYRKYFSNDQLQQVINRAATEGKLKSMVDSKYANKHKFKNFILKYLKRGASNIGNTIFDSVTKDMARTILASRNIPVYQEKKKD